MTDFSNRNLFWQMNHLEYGSWEGGDDGKGTYLKSDSIRISEVDLNYSFSKFFKYLNRKVYKFNEVKYIQFLKQKYSLHHIPIPQCVLRKYKTMDLCSCTHTLLRRTILITQPTTPPTPLNMLSTRKNVCFLHLFILVYSPMQYIPCYVCVLDMCYKASHI